MIPLYKLVSQHIIYWHRVLRLSHFIVIFPCDRSHFIYDIILMVFQIMSTHMAVYTHLTHSTKQIWLTHFKCESCMHYAKLAFRSKSSTYMFQNTTHCIVYFACHFHVCVRNKYVPPLPHISHIC